MRSRAVFLSLWLPLGGNVWHLGNTIWYTQIACQLVFTEAKAVKLDSLMAQFNLLVLIHLIFNMSGWQHE